MTSQKCCSNCPGRLIPPRSNESHLCCQPKYITGNLRRSSLEKHIPECPKSKMESSSPNQPPCYDRFALAKRLHAENLEHQPLPDKVDDSIFKSIRGGKLYDQLTAGKFDDESLDDIKKRNIRYGPVLGCKEPKTRMDLAICWETPIDPVYEAARPTHIDGSEGGLAPAIFTLVRHTSNSRASVHSGAIEMKERKDKSQVYECTENPVGSLNGNKAENKEEDHRSVTSRNSCECLCKNLSQVNIRKEDHVKDGSKRRTFRNCTACDVKNVRDDPRLIKSAVGLALGLGSGKSNQRRNELPGKVKIPRPKTPFARRSFCIDTLAPPFSVLNGSRDADYPEHWRLMSVYQQSYRNPQKRRNLCRC